MSYELIELCCGTAALTFHRLGLSTPVSMMGSKKTLAPQIAEILEIAHDRPSHVVLVDRGEWGLTLGTLFTGGWNRVADVLEYDWGAEPERALFDRLRTTPLTGMTIERAAAHLWLQSRTYRGKEVYPTESGWKTHGFDPEWRGAAKPGSKPRGSYNSRPNLAAKLRNAALVEGAFRLAGEPWPLIGVACVDARNAALPPQVEARRVFFIDPPYRLREPYRCSLPREDVAAIAFAHHSNGADVYVCEGEPVEELVAIGWKAVQLDTRRGGTQLSKTGHEEWITFRRAA